jgi:hypothetical protein
VGPVDVVVRLPVDAHAAGTIDEFCWTENGRSNEVMP